MDERVVMKPVRVPIFHPYSDEPQDGIEVLAYDYVEAFAEKFRALAERTRPRDLYDVFNSELFLGARHECHCKIMKVIILGATGMVGQGVLRASLVDDEISSLLAVGRTMTGIASQKLHQIQHSDLLDYLQRLHPKPPPSRIDFWDRSTALLGRRAGVNFRMGHRAIPKAPISSLPFAGHLRQHWLVLVYMVINDYIALGRVQAVTPPGILRKCSTPGDRYRQERRIEARVIKIFAMVSWLGKKRS